MDLQKLMSPQSVVVVGATDKPGMPGGATTSALLGAIRDRVYFLNPKRDELLGRRCYHSLSELPEVVDCMVVCTAARFVPGYLEEGGRLGIPAAVVFASGFSEERTDEAKALAEEVRTICEKYDIALCGPNCVGIFNGVDKVTVSAGDPVMLPLLEPGERRGIGLVAQSGYITSGFSAPDVSKLAYVVSAGNCTMCSIEDYMLWFAQNDSVNCIAAYIEGVRKPERLEQALREAALRRKPVVVLKAGATEKGSFAAASHTGSLAGDYKTVVSVLKKYGVVVTRSLQEFVSTARMFAVLDGNFPKTFGVGGVNFSGGENTLCADTCDRCGITLPEYAPETAAAIGRVVPSYSTPSNPLDATTTLFSETEKVEALFAAVSGDPAIGLITLGNDVGLQSEPKDLTCAEVLGRMKAEGRLVPAVVVPSFEKPRNPDVRKSFEDAGIPVLSTGDLAYRAVRHLLDFAAYDAGAVTLSLSLPGTAPGGGTRALSEAASKAELVPWGVRVPRQALAASIDEVDDCLAKIPFPVAMKVESPDILHKTDAGGVKLNIQTPEEARSAFREIMTSCRSYKPDAAISGVMLQEMVPQGTEIIIGVKNDKQFGPMLLVGLGGVFVEVFGDTALYPCPLGKEEALNMLRSLKGYKLLAGYRGTVPRDVDALAELMVKISDYAVAHKETLAELDLNPVFVYPEGEGVCVTDALIVVRA